MGKVIFEFDIWDESEEVLAVVRRHENAAKLNEIYNLCRNELKHGEEELSDNIEELLGKIQELSWYD